MAHHMREGPDEREEPDKQGDLWMKRPPAEVRSALKIIADYYGVEPEELEGLLDSIVPLLDP